MFHSTLRVSAFAALTTATIAAQQPNVVLTKVFATNTPLPNGPSTWSSLGYPAADGEWVSFVAYGRNTPYDAVLKVPATGGPAVVVADTNTPIPGGTGNFASFWNPSAYDGTVVFSAQRPGLPASSYWVMTGAYAADPAGRLSRVTDLASGQPMICVNYASHHARVVAYKDGDDRGPQALRFVDPTGVDTIAVTTGMTPPGGGTFFSLGRPALSGAQMVFDATLGGTAGTYGVYGYDVSTRTLRLVANASTPEPRTGQGFTLVRNPATDGRSTVFLGVVGNPLFGGVVGIFEESPGQPLRTVVDNSTLVPGTGSTFDNFHWSCVGDGLVAFEGIIGVASVVRSGVYVRTPGGSLIKIVDSEDVLEGRGVRSASLSHNSLRGHDLAFLVDFDDGGRAIYVAHIGDFVVNGQPAVGGTFGIGIDRPEEAGRAYLSPFALATTPGIPLSDGRVFPLAPDGLFTESLAPGSPVFANTIGQLDATGRATYQLTLPAIPALRGLTLHTAWLTADLTGTARIRTLSAPLALTIR